MTSRGARCLPGVAALAAVAAAGCGGEGHESPADRVREATRDYLTALEDGRWARACGLMTPAARRDVEAAANAPCGPALAGGGALPPEQLAAARREVAGARVRVRGSAAVIGPLGVSPAPLRLRRSEGRWLVAG